MTCQKSQEIRNEIYKFLYHSYGHNNCAKSKKYDINKYAYNYVLLLLSNNLRILWSINHSFVHIAVIATNIKYNLSFLSALLSLEVFLMLTRYQYIFICILRSKIVAMLSSF